MPRGIPKIGHRINRVYRPDLTDHFILVHPKRQLGIIKFNANKTKACVCPYSFDLDGDMHLGKASWVTITDEPKGKCIIRKDKRHYLSEFIRPPANPYS